LAVFEVCGMVPLAVGAWRQVRSSAGRVARVAPATVPAGIPLDSDPAAQTGAPLAPRGAAPTITFAGLSAHWPEFGAADGDADAPAAGAPSALRDLSLTIGAGERVLVRGESGAGKTTLANVLVRFIDYDGSFTLGGREARTMSPSELRRTVGLCEQQPWI